MADNGIVLPLDSIEARFAEIQERIDEFPPLVKAHADIMESFEGTTDEGLAELEPKELDRQRAALNKSITAIRSKRAEIGKLLDVPKKELYGKVDELLAAADALLARMDEARKRNKEGLLEARRQGLMAYYEGDVAASVKYVVATFDDIFDPAWVKSDAAYKRAFGEMLDRAARISDDWECLKKMDLNDREEAERMFVRTLDLAATVSADEARARELEAIREWKGEQAEPEQAEPMDYEPPVFEEVEPEPAPMSEHPAEPFSELQRKRYTFTVLLSDLEFKAFKRWKTGWNGGAGIGGDWTCKAIDALAIIKAQNERIAKLEAALTKKEVA